MTKSALAKVMGKPSNDDVGGGPFERTMKEYILSVEAK